jgi:ABC-type nitrate/sulfonate/bicarbonate transport system substrate-binding protein
MGLWLPGAGIQGEAMQKKSLTAGLAVIAVIALAGLGAWYFLDSQKSAPEPAESITVAYSPFEYTALYWIAEDQHFFEKNGLNITLRKYDSGAASLDGVLNGEADITVGVSEFPLVGKALQNAPVRVIGNIDTGNFIYIVAREDRGIENVSDLKGKRVGTTIGTVAEFHLGRFLTLHGMTLQDITLVDVKTPEGWVNAVADGDIDAISTAQPYADAARDRLGDNAVVWPAQSSQPLFGLVVSMDEWITHHPDTARRVLLSLSQAEEYTIMHPAEARTIVQKQLNLDPEYMDTVWSENQFSLSLDQSLVLAMEDEARWMIANNLTNATAVPDFRHYVYTDGLEAVRPGSVNIIG